MPPNLCPNNALIAVFSVSGNCDAASLNARNVVVNFQLIDISISQASEPQRSNGGIASEYFSKSERLDELFRKQDSVIVRYLKWFSI